MAGTESLLSILRTTKHWIAITRHWKKRRKKRASQLGVKYMNTKLLIITALFAFLFLMLGTVRECGDFGSTLILKPYPSFHKTFGGGEERHCLESLPTWIADGHYLKVAYHPGESSPSFWQYFYLIFNVSVFVLVFASIISVLRKYLTRQGSIRKKHEAT